MLILASYVPPHLREQAHHRAAQILQDGAQRTALAEGLRLRAACEAKRAGAQPLVESAEEPMASREHRDIDFDFDFDTEVARIQQLCDAFHSPAAEAFALEHRLEHRLDQA
ncbi:DUF6545 domain-containing protein [Streptomyces sp. NPDC018045]|uniref:DUF6545 domain-containing protein n=1 Tax=Streptomyces sp. NPDC018045 TaxID=3365037 RepID=UPI00378F8C6C